ncbi:hypothetical protein COO91_01881 [Nostoc flagelliforme CCNUN1]|uniref:Uncharacterized protein n=1 Tax=Nostoc flagelliforme CCNUN1 TaxID=2038116 RepID=A0A2K8SKR0_9NOSO|nr:hypothetical protein [Nostoc flagelliforme]AUB35988.1 hypothetical protein COO91_01881 [Nostoc flagelliforme CCNUN1]
MRVVAIAIDKLELIGSDRLLFPLRILLENPDITMLYTGKQ